MRRESNFLLPGKFPEPMATVSAYGQSRRLDLGMWHFTTKSRMANLQLVILQAAADDNLKEELCNVLDRSERDWLTGVSSFHNFEANTFGAIKKISNSLGKVAA